MRGFTLVELIISLSLLLLLCGSFSAVFVKEARLAQAIALLSEKEQIKNFVFEKIKSDIRAAREILAASNKDTLSLKIDSDLLEYSLVNAKVRRKKNSASQYLCDSQEIKNLSFLYSGGKLVTVELDDFIANVALRNL